MKFHKIILSALTLGVLLSLPLVQVRGETPLAQFEKELKPLFTKHCQRCHGAKKQESDFRIDQLNPDLVSGPDAGYWHEVLNQINAGTLPPEGAPPLSERELATATGWLEA